MSDDRRLDWLLAEFVRATPGVRQAVVVSADGLRLAVSPGVDDGLGDQLAAAASGITSLARGTAHLLGGGPVAQTILEMAHGYFFVTAISAGAGLAVHADRNGDIGMIGYEMTMLAGRVGHALTVPAHGGPVVNGDEPGRVVPVYALTGGRTRSGSADLPIESMVTLAADIGSRGRLQQEHRAILDLATRPVSLVEVGAHLRVPVGVARVLVSDLAAAGYLNVHRPSPTDPDGRPSPELLTRLLEGLRAR